MGAIGSANYYLGTVVAVTKDDDERLKNEKEWHEVLVDIPGIIQGVRAFPFRDELDEPKKGDKVLVLDLDPMYHSYMLYQKVKENGFIGFRSSGKVVDITPDQITVGVYDPEKIKDYKDDEIPKSLDASIVIKNGGDVIIKSASKISIDAYGNPGNCIVINGGNNGGVINVNFLKSVITAINSDLLVAGSGANLGGLMGALSQLEDKNLLH